MSAELNCGRGQVCCGLFISIHHPPSITCELICFLPFHSIILSFMCLHANNSHVVKQPVLFADTAYRGTTTTFTRVVHTTLLHRRYTIRFWYSLLVLGHTT